MTDVTTVPQSSSPSHADLSGLLEALPVGVRVLDARGTILSVNRAELEFLGYSATEYVGKSLSDFYVNKQQAVDALYQLNTEGALGAHGVQMYCRDGRPVSVVASSSGRFVDGALVSSLWFTQPIPRDELDASMPVLLASIAESAQDAIVTKDLDGIITSWNPSAEHLFGYSAEEAVGRSIRMIIPQDRQQEEDDILRRVRHGERVGHFETIRCRKDGSLINVSLTISPLRDSHGRIFGASKVARDISVQKRAEEELQHSLSAKDDFLGLVSHELRTPLTTLKGTANVLRRHTHRLSEDEKREALLDIEASADRLLGIVENMLTVARVENRGQHDSEPILLSRVVARIVAEQQAQYRLHSLRFDPPSSVIPVVGSEAYVRLILENLLSNARKYSRQGSEIAVTVHHLMGFVEVRVSDRGIGISEEVSHAIFEPFVRTDAAERRATGIGLGLTVVKRLVEAQGGTIRAEPRAGGGSTFAFALPVYRDLE